ncbi:MAG TPA: hypothetical protein VF824_15605 [Thermoanaerobaculia bacterium]
MRTIENESYPEFEDLRATLVQDAEGFMVTLGDPEDAYADFLRFVMSRESIHAT